MEAKPAQQNIQDSFLNTARKERHNITIYLVSGVKLTGRIRSFDKYSVVLETSNQEQLIFKHAISTVVIARPAHGHGEGKDRGEEDDDRRPGNQGSGAFLDPEGSDPAPARSAFVKRNRHESKVAGGPLERTYDNPPRVPGPVRGP